MADAEYGRPMMTPDIAIRHVRIADGSGGSFVEGDVEIKGDRITAVGSARAARREIDGQGQVLSPGFVDVHTHDDGALLAYPGMDFKLAQGCTSVVVGNCGSSAIPPADDPILGSMNRTWSDLDGYFEAVAMSGPSVNVMAQIGHNTVRRAVMGMERRAPTRAELASMRGLVEMAMEQGTSGFSTGLIYQPGRYSETEEVVELTRPCAEHGGVYNSHIRNEGERLFEAVDELVHIGAEAGCSCHISHHKAAGRANWGRVAESLDRVDAANAAGGDITLDVYPYTAGSGPMYQYFDPSDIDRTLGEAVQIAACVDFPELEGRRLVDVAAETGETIESIVHRIITAPHKERTICVHFIIDEADIETNLRHPLMMVGSDGIPNLKGRPHPRLFGTFPRVLGRYVRERGVMELPEAVRKMTSLACDRFGLVDRGRIVEGGFADLVLFDDANVIDTATYDDPKREPDGIAAVIVNGELALEAGRHTGVGSGRPLRYRRGD